MEVLKLGEAKLVVHIHPSKINGAKSAILNELNSLLFTYSEIFDGVVLAYVVDDCSNLARILPGIHPSFGVRVDARLLLFKPTPGTILEGRVVKITPQSIHAVVLGFSSVFIADEDIREDFKLKINHGEEVYVSGDNNNKHTIKVGTLLRFVVKSFDEEQLHISGSMVAKHTGCARWLDRNVDEWSQAHSTKEKRKSGNQEVESPNNEVTTNEKTSSVKSDKHAKKSKKRRKADLMLTQ